MGGFGSGRRGTRATVEDCPTVDVNILAKGSLLRADCFGAHY